MQEREAEAVLEELVSTALSLFQRGYSYGSAGNLSVRQDRRIFITPTGSSLGALQAASMAAIEIETGEILGGARPSKEYPMHLAAYRARPDVGAVVHLHSTYAVALSCLDNLDPGNALQPVTPYFAMKVGRLPVIPYYRPGAAQLAAEVARMAPGGNAFLLANHGSLVLGSSLADACSVAEELEEQARLHFILAGRGRRLTSAELQDL